MNLTGRSLKQYHLVGELGKGGMGVVYRARDTVLGRDAALKVLPADMLQSDEARGRFLREARAASALNHPNVITIYEIGCADGIDFIAMEYVAGHTVQWLLRERRLSVAEAANYAYQTADALTKAHGAGVVHRDIKPSNLVITDDGRVKVLDFGLARLNEAARTAVDDDAPTNALFATRAGTVLGTVAYMSPEQARGEEAGPESDIFSLGVVLFEMLSGQLPFAGASEFASLHNLHFAPPKDLRLLSPDVPDGLVRIVARMLEKDLGQRYGSMAEVRQDLRPFAGVTNMVTEPPEPATVARSRATPASAPRGPITITRPVLAGLAAILLVGVAIAAGWLALPNRMSARVDLPPPSAEAFDPETASAYDLYVRARALLDRFDREDNPAQAITLLERAVEKDTGFALGYATLTEAYRYRNQRAPDEQWQKLMTQSAQRALQLNPELGAAHIAMALVMMGGGKTTEAEGHLRRAIELDPRNPAPLLWSAVLFNATGRAKDAAESVQRALTIDPNNWAALQERGLIDYRAADYAGAITAWEQARAASPDNVRVLANLAAAYHMADRYEDAASTLQRAIEIEPAARHYANLGTLRFFQGRYEDAIAPFERAVELTPNRYLYWGNLADAYRWAPGHRPKARAAYERAIDLLRAELLPKPTDPDLRAHRALYLAKSGQTAEALQELSGLESATGNTAAVSFRLAVTYEICGDRAKALSSLEKALSAGYPEKEVRGAPELVELRNDIRYHKIVAAIPNPGSH